MNEIYLNRSNLKHWSYFNSNAMLKSLIVKNKKKLNNSEKEYLYIISNPIFPRMFKIGITSSLKLRLCSYQTSDPYRRYKLEFSSKFINARVKELLILQYYNSKTEWVHEESIQELIRVVKILIL